MRTMSRSPGCSKIEADLVHYELTGGTADQYILFLVPSEMVTETLNACYHPKGSNN